MVRKILPLVLLLSLFAFLPSSTVIQEQVIFSELPIVEAKWILAAPGNYLGSLIKATLLVSTQPGVTLNLSLIPDVGDVVRLPPKLVYSQEPTDPSGYLEMVILEGELEVVSRTINIYHLNGLVVTQVDYHFQYLQPLDLSEPVDDKKLPNPRLSQAYFTTNSDGSIYARTKIIQTVATDFYLIPRVDENSQPFFKFFTITPEASPWLLLQALGFGFIAVSLGLTVWWVTRIVGRLRHPQYLLEDQPSLDELYSIWTQQRDENTFIKALILYRAGTWGYPQPATWITTTFILYSGIRLEPEQMDTIFTKIIKEVQ